MGTEYDFFVFSLVCSQKIYTINKNTNQTKNMKTIFSVPFIALATVQGSEATGLRKRNLATSFPGGEGCANYDNPVVNHEHLCPNNKDYPTVKSIKIINQCDYPLVLTDWECQVPSKQQCTVGESCTGTNQGKEPFVSNLPMCSDSGHKMRKKMTYPDRIEWYIPGSRGVGGDANYNITDFLEINTVNFHGAGDKLGHSSFSQWQGYSMSKQYVTRDVTTGALACLDLGLLLLATQLTLLLADTLNLAPQTTTLSSFSLLLHTLLDGMKLAALDR